jgi:hypothetical protein
VTTIYVELSNIAVLPTYFTKSTSLQPTCKQFANKLQPTGNQLATNLQPTGNQLATNWQPTCKLGSTALNHHERNGR